MDFTWLQTGLQSGLQLIQTTDSSVPVLIITGGTLVSSIYFALSKSELETESFQKMIGGLVKTAAVVGVGAAVAKWVEMAPNSSAIMLASLGTAGVALTVVTRAKTLKPNGRAVFITGRFPLNRGRHFDTEFLDNVIGYFGGQHFFCPPPV